MTLQKLGPFELLQVLGRGGMGTVYKARETKSGDIVAVKALAPVYSFDEHFRSRFAAEIEALLKLSHNNIVRLLSYGQDEGNLFFAMELVEGNSLFIEQKQGHVFHWREVIDIAIQVCCGLRHAHDRGIIHRDLKPGNLMLDPSRTIKITDFGIAKSFGSTSMTHEGNVLGTMDFMAPEQARGKPANARSDLFSLGAVLYSLLAGHPPFLRETVELTFESLLSNNPPKRLNDVASDVPVPLAQLIHRMLEKDPAKRIATAHATERQLKHVLDAVSNAESPDTQVLTPENDKSKSDLITGDSNSATFLASNKKGQSEQDFSSQTAQAESGPDEEPTSIPKLPGPQTVEKPDPQNLESLIKQPDYFNEITPQQRDKQQSVGETGTQIEKIWPIVAALVIVLGLVAAGIWYTVIRTRSEQYLLSRIERNYDTPTRASDEINAFLYYYPNHAKAETVQQAKNYAKAIRHKKLLDARSKLSNGDSLTQISRQFLEITELEYAQSSKASRWMKRFLDRFGETERLSEADRYTIEMARIYYPVLQKKARKVIEFGTADIDDSMMMARTHKVKDKAISIYQYVIEVYGEDDWAKQSVDAAKRELAKLLNQPPDASNGQPPAPSEKPNLDSSKK